MIKLNLGAGTHAKDGFISVDKYPPADVICDLEIGKWPWEDSSVNEVLFHHSLEHMGQRLDAFFHIIKELYRVCKNGAKIVITVPHPRSDDFINDPTHVRIITPQIMVLFDKEWNERWKESGSPNTPLAFHLGVNFKTVDCDVVINDWFKGYPEMALKDAILTKNNVIKQVTITLKAVK